MKKNIFLLLLIVFVVVFLSVSCAQKIEEPEQKVFIANIPECFWGNWIVDSSDFFSAMHFDIDKHHIFQWVENFDTPDTAHDCCLIYSGTTEKMFDPSIYHPKFGTIGYEQKYLQVSDRHSFSSSLTLKYDPETDMVEYQSIHINKYNITKMYTYYLKRAN